MARTSKIKSKSKAIKDMQPKKKIIIDSNVKRSKKSGKPVGYDVLVGLDGKVKQMVPINDSFSNPWANIGYGTDALINKTEYPLTRMSYNYNLLNSLYRDNWVVQNIVSLIPEDMCKNWIKLKTDIDNKLLDRFNKVIRKTKVKRKIVEGLKWGRLYGGALGLIVIEGQDDKLEEPLDLDSIELDSFKGLYIVDRWNGVEPDSELIDELGNPEYGQPKYYKILNEDGAVMNRIHHSRVIKFIGRELPHWEKIAEQYWGSSEIESVYQEVIKRDNVSNNLANLTFKACISIYKMENVDQLFAIAGTQAQKRFWDMINAQQILESNFATRVIDKDAEYHKEQYTFTGLSDVYDSIMMDVAGATHIPVTKLFGRSPAGMNSTGESDLQNYYDYVEEERESKLTPVIEKLLPIIAMSAFGYIPEDLDFEYNDVRTLSEEKKIEIGSNKANIYLQAFQNGAITQKTLLNELSKLGDKYDIFTTIDEDAINNAQDKTAMELQSMQDPMAGLMGGGDENEEETENTNEGANTEQQSMEGMDRQNNQQDSEEEITDEDRMLSNIVENITPYKAEVIESGKKYEKPLIGPPEPIITENQFEELKAEDTKTDNTPMLVKVINRLIETLRGK